MAFTRIYDTPFHRTVQSLSLDTHTHKKNTPLPIHKTHPPIQVGRRLKSLDETFDELQIGVHILQIKDLVFLNDKTDHDDDDETLGPP